jgi:hypothetical protein
MNKATTIPAAAKAAVLVATLVLAISVLRSGRGKHLRSSGLQGLRAAGLHGPEIMSRMLSTQTISKLCDAYGHDPKESYTGDQKELFEESYSEANDWAQGGKNPLETTLNKNA